MEFSNKSTKTDVQHNARQTAHHTAHNNAQHNVQHNAQHNVQHNARHNTRHNVRHNARHNAHHNSRGRHIELSYSVFLEDNNINKNKDPNQLPSRLHAWVEDESVTNCYGCDATFGWTIRKHHCRLCGKIFCYDCSNFFRVIPKDLLSDDSKKGTFNDTISYYSNYTNEENKQRVCKSCNYTLINLQEVGKITEKFLLWGLDIPTLKNALRVCKTWKTAANRILHTFEEIKNKLPTNNYTDVEKQLLWKNAKFLSGHNKYLIALLKTCRSEDDVNAVKKIIKKGRIVHCSVLHCSRNCNKNITSSDSINLLAHCFKYSTNFDVLKRLAIDYLVCNDKEFKCLLPFLIYNLQYDKSGLLFDHLIIRCKTNFDLLNALFCELNLFCSEQVPIYIELLNKLKEIISKDKKNFVKLLDGNAFVNKLDEIEKDSSNGVPLDEINRRYKLNEDDPQSALTLPINPKIKIKQILIEDLRRVDSASKPIILPCITTSGKRIKIMYKREDVRKDQIVMNIIRLANMIIRRELGIDLNIVEYEVLPTKKESGLIEIVDCADTIFKINYNDKNSVLNYILDGNSDKTVREVREKFIKSTAFSSVITYLLGVGDRHLDNIMVTQDGRLFHIDFGYILGQDPVFNNPSIRITPEIVQTVGGVGSEYYVLFIDYCNKIYNCLRKNVDIFMNMLLLLPKISDLKITEAEIKRQVIKRFIPGENNVDAKFHLVNKLESDSITDTVKDFCHYHNKTTVNSVNKILSYTLSYFWYPGNQ